MFIGFRSYVSMYAVLKVSYYIQNFWISSQMSAFQREGDSVTDKTVKIPEYESAARTKQKKPVKYAAQPKPEKGRAPSQQIDTANKYHPM